MRDVLAGVALLGTEEPAVDPVLPGVLLCRGVEVAVGTDAGEQRLSVRAPEVVRLSAAAVVTDARAAVVLDDRTSRSAISVSAVSQSISSKPPSGRRRSGVVSRRGCDW